MHKLLSVIGALLLFAVQANAQTHNLKGIVMDGEGKPMKFASVSLLHPADSTLAFFGISTAAGVVEVKNVTNGNYLLQAAMLGYKTYYAKVTVPVSNNDLGPIIIDQLNVQHMNEVVITGERVPLLIKNDTVEYNAGAFKTKPDANVEELLKKMPGIEVDRAGNIKAQGEQVSKVFVDGKEFFGNDPKVATQNLPADAINKVQVFDKKSDMSEFTGIDDGSRERTINLTLKDGKKQGYFGDVTAGGGTDERYKGAAKLYRFRPKSQFAALGMMNNINRSGFSLSDYLNFSGGMQSMMNGGGNFTMELSGDDNLPLDFGRPVNGIVTSAAAGLNYSYELARNRRLTVSYMGNGANKKLNESTWSRNFVQEAEYTTDGAAKQETDNIAHRLSMNIRNDIDSYTQVTFAASGELTNNRQTDNGISSSQIADVVVNTQNRNNRQLANAIGGKSSLSFTRRSSTGKDVLAISGNGGYKQNLKEDEWGNITTLTGQQPQVINSRMFRDDRLITYNYGGQAVWSHTMGKGFFAEPQVRVGSDVAMLNREQGISPAEDVIIDSLSPDFNTNYTYIRPGLTIKKSTRKVQYNVGLNYELGYLSQQQGNAVLGNRQFGYLLPSATWRNEYATGKHLSFSYNTSVDAPGYSQLLTVPVIAGPLSVSAGNSALRPEYKHAARMGWMYFDQFTMTSLFVNLNGSYTHDKINRAVTIDNNLAQYNSLVNVADDYAAGAGVQFDRPIGKLGIKVNTALNERYTKSITLVNGVENITTSLMHEWRLGVENKKKNKWDAEIGGMISITDARYSVQQSLNNVFYNTGGYAELSYRPNDHWYFLLSADVTVYNQQSFQNSVIVPLLRSEVSYYFLKGNRGVLTLEGFDLLNANKDLQRVSQQNYLAEVRSDIIGQYFMLSFKYRLNKTGKKSAMMFDDIDINMR